MHLKARLLAIVLILVFAGLTYLSWHELLTTGRYSIKMRFATVGIVGGLFLLAFSTKARRYSTATRLRRFLGENAPSRHNRIAVEDKSLSSPRVAEPATLGWRPLPPWGITENLS